jgi:hypothetical protein
MTKWPLRWIVPAIAVIALYGKCCAQQGTIRIPEGRRHFIVLVDSSASMVARSLPPAPPGTKRKALAAAERDLASYLFTPDRIVKGRWFRRGQDLITVVQYGIDSKPHADRAYLRLKDARLDSDYVRRILRADTNVDRKHFVAALHPKLHTNLNILAWALPLGLSISAAPGRPVQDTFVILLNDAQMNDGSMVLEKHTMGMHLNETARQKLASAEKLVDASVQLTGKAGLSSTWFEKSFGQGSDLVVMTCFKANPTTTTSAAARYMAVNPLDSLRLEESGSGLIARLEPQPDQHSLSAALSLQAGNQATYGRFVLNPGSTVKLKGIAGQRAVATLSVTQVASNPVLGRQEFQIVYREPVLLPAGTRTRAVLCWILIAVLALAGGAWCYGQLTVARHFQLWLPGYVTSFELPALSQCATSRYIVRQPADNGELAAVLTLPSPLIRELFYRNATLRWDGKLSLKRFPDTEMAKMNKLPKIAEFVWRDRPAAAGEFNLNIERPSRTGRNQRAKICVRFLALQNSTRSVLETS